MAIDWAGGALTGSSSDQGIGSTTSVSPARAAAGGGIVTVAPGKGGLGAFAPLLDVAGNSVKGQLAASFLARRLGLYLFASEPELDPPAVGDAPRPRCARPGAGRGG